MILSILVAFTLTPITNIGLQEEERTLAAAKPQEIDIRWYRTKQTTYAQHAAMHLGCTDKDPIDAGRLDGELQGFGLGESSSKEHDGGGSSDEEEHKS